LKKKRSTNRAVSVRSVGTREMLSGVSWNHITVTKDRTEGY
jgi:hypothetical protein